MEQAAPQGRSKKQKTPGKKPKEEVLPLEASTSTSSTVANEAASKKDRGIGSLGMILAVLIFFLAPSVEWPHKTSVEERPLKVAIESSALETGTGRSDMSAIALQGIAVFNGGQLPFELSGAAAAIRGSHDVVISCRAFLMTEVASSIREASDSLSFSNFRKAESAVDDTRQCSSAVVQSLNVARGIVVIATGAVVEFDGNINAAKWGLWKELMIPHFFNAVEEEYDRFLFLIKDLDHVATQLQIITQFRKPLASSNPNEVPGIADEVGTKLHAAVLERTFLNALAANIQRAEGVRRWRLSALGTIPEGSKY